MKNLIKTVAVIIAIAPVAAMASNLPVDFPSTFPEVAQPATQLDISTSNEPVVTIEANTQK
ncbi:MAG: hypothetical protein JKX71_13315 [Amylibacter sp.]|nr:hypothetical protein [Amylibacter sp.]